ncbi:MAG: GAF domain-containing protein [Pseudomonadota bacterium]|nr:GAF domain-containing protein [Pseudomonadota bacterium]
MPTYKISSDKLRVSVESDSWLYAVASALPQFGLEPNALDQMICSMNPDGSIGVMDAVSKVRMRVSSEEDDQVCGLEMPPASMTLDGAEPPVDLVPPPRSWGWDVGAPSTRLAVALERVDTIYAAPDVATACNIALQIVTNLVAADSGAVLLRGAGTKSLSFEAAVGPQASRVLKTTLPMAEGIAGFSYTSGIGVIIQNVDADGRFASEVDRASGYRTRSLLAAPVRVVDGPIFGCLELLNAPAGFQPEDLEIVRVVAGALAGRLRALTE